MTSPIRDDRDLSAAVHSWLSELDGPAPDRGQQIGRIMGQVQAISQRRRLWPRNPFGRGAVGAVTTESETAVVPANGRTTALLRMRTLSALATVVLVTVSLMWVASRPLQQPLVPAGWPVDPADRGLFEGFASLWAGDGTDLLTTREVYGGDAVHSVLWLDHEEVISGDFAIWNRMRASMGVDPGDSELTRLPDHSSGARRYLLTPASPTAASLAGAACVLWVDEARVARHDCILPTTYESEAPPSMVAPDPTSRAAREVLTAAFTDALSASDREAVEVVVSPEITHHVLSANQVYTLEGIDEYWNVLGFGGPGTSVNVDLPAFEGELRWANFSDVSTGTLCVFEARAGLITGHDCIVPSTTTVPVGLTEIGTPPGT